MIRVCAGVPAAANRMSVFYGNSLNINSIHVYVLNVNILCVHIHNIAINNCVFNDGILDHIQRWLVKNKKVMFVPEQAEMTVSLQSFWRKHW